MMKKTSVLAMALLFTTGVLAAAADNVAVQDPYVRLAPPGAPATAAFMVLKNSGDKDVKVVKADNPASKVTEIHNHINDGGIMKMRPVPALEVKARGETVLKPGGLHIMLIDLKGAMKEGNVVPITLGFDDGSSKKVEAKVMKPTAVAGPMEHQHQHQH